MGENQDHGDFIDSMTRFAMRQTSRRGFIKWVAKGGVAFAAGMMASFEWLTGTALAGINCSEYLPGCEGACTCATSECQDPDNGLWFYCEGECPAPCGPPEAYKYWVHVFWYYSSSKQNCVQAKNCIPC
jgi:hypothetical protein